jgi:hypothetical protein
MRRRVPSRSYLQIDCPVGCCERSASTDRRRECQTRVFLRRAVPQMVPPITHNVRRFQAARAAGNMHHTSVRRTRCAEGPGPGPWARYLSQALTQGPSWNRELCVVGVSGLGQTPSSDLCPPAVRRRHPRSHSSSKKPPDLQVRVRRRHPRHLEFAPVASADPQHLKAFFGALPGLPFADRVPL